MDFFSLCNELSDTYSFTHSRSQKRTGIDDGSA